MSVSGNGLERDAQQVLGYLNYSTGPTDIPFLAALNRVGTAIATAESDGDEAARETFPVRLAKFLRAQLAQLHATSPAFSNCEQAVAVLHLVFDVALARYREFHRDLLFHQTDDALFNAFFIGRMCEAILRQGGPWTEADRIIPAAITQLNDYIGHRPVPALESQKIEPYPHEWVRPVPIFIRGAGVAHGRYAEVVTLALELLEHTDEEILREAHFDPQLMEELAFDPSAYDFDHPANKRPNYHFGQWDPNRIDNQGRYRRFIVQQVSLGALLARLDEESDIPHEQIVLEGAAVLAGIVLMAAGVSGRGPEAHDSSVTLSTLLPRIAAYRDQFYERLIGKLDGAHAERLRKEAKEKRQPFGGARQELNAQLARRRAAQLEHVHLAKLFARMGYPEAAAKQADVVPAASARMLCRIDCLLTAGHQALDRGDRTAAAGVLPEILDQLKRAIECGATIDPWNILGFDAQYSLFPAIENSVRDHRADELVALMERIFALFSRTWSEAAASDDQTLALKVSTQFQTAATWWHKFAAHEVQTVGTPSSLETYQAAEHVAESLRLWHQGGAAAGDVKFWAPHAARFDSPKAYALVVEALLERRDFVASLALLVSWLSHATRIGLEQGESSFCKLAESWLRLWRLTVSEPGEKSKSSPHGSHEPWALVRRFFDCLEANAEEFGETPSFELNGIVIDLGDEDEEEEDDAEADLPGEEGEGEGGEEDDDEDRFDSAYEDMVYRDSTGDGVESDTMESGGASDEELELEAKRIGQRIDFLECLAQLWKLAAYWPMPQTAGPEGEAAATGRVEDLRRWLARARANQQSLTRLLGSVEEVGSSRVDLQACKLEYSIVSPK